ncbi:ankyrin unc44 [Fusarium pseudoanthophilum]|uniref:Ankyrin unc44 n=1 Tax=Fusarium pseudoanthophilum TaxID=48495 RepID=A0A8H5NWP1_9HYPO|nr:ankyrin unc44 [Fusarium pseudoanthophilum]
MAGRTLTTNPDDGVVHDKDATVLEDPSGAGARRSDSNGSRAHEEDESDEPKLLPLHKKLLEIAEAEQPANEATLDEFRALLRGKASDINALDEDGRTALHIAIEHGLTTEARWIIDDEANIDIADNEGQQPLYLACEKGHTELVQLLLSKAANINAASHRDETPLTAACRNGHTKVVNLLLNERADTKISDKENWTPLHWASVGNHKEILARLLEVDKSNIDATMNVSDWTALNVAAYLGHKEIVSLLLSRNADLCIDNYSKWTPLMSATRRNHKEIVISILAHETRGRKRYLEMRDKRNNTPLHIASEEGFHDIATQLVGAGADCTAKDSHGMTPLHLSSFQNHSKIVELLLSETPVSVVDVNAEADDGRTSLHLASRQGNELIVKALFRKKASVDARNKTGMTPLHLASGANAEDRCLSDPDPVSPGPSSDNDPEWEKRNSEAKSGRHLQVVELLLQKGADASIKASNGHTALHYAAASGDYGRIRVLLERMGADKLSWGDWRDSPIHSALDGHDPRTAMEALLSKSEIKLAPFWEHDGRFQVIKKVLEDDKPRDIPRLILREVSGDDQKLPEESESWNLIQWAAYERLPRELSEQIDMARPDDEVYESIHNALLMTCNSNIAEELVSETSCARLIQVMGILITNSARTPENINAVKKASGVVEAYHTSSEEGVEKSRKNFDRRRQQMLPLLFPGPEVGMNELSSGNKADMAQENDKLEDAQQPSQSQFMHMPQNSETHTMKSLQDHTTERGKSPDSATRLQDILKDPPFNQISRSYKDEADYKPPVFKPKHLGIVAKAEATVVAFYKRESESGRIRRNRTLQTIVYGAGPTEAVGTAVGDLIDLKNKGFMHFNSELYTQQNLKLTWVHLPSTNMVWMNCLQDLLTTIMHNERYQTQEYSKARSFFRDSWVVVPDKESHSRMMRPQSVVRTKTQKADGEVVRVGEYSTNHPGKVEAVVADSKEGGKKRDNNRDSESHQPTKKHEFAHASAIYMPYLAYSSHCGELSETQDTKLKEAHQANQSLLDSYNGKDEQQHGSPTLDEWYYQFAQDDPEATNDQKQRNKSQVVSKYLKENEDERSASKGNRCTVVRVNQLWIWTIADNWIITSTSSPFDSSPDVLVDDILSVLSKQAEYGGSRAQPIFAADLVHVIVDHCIGSYERRPDDSRRISIGQTFSHYINRIGRKETNLFEDFRVWSLDENRRKTTNSKAHKQSPVEKVLLVAKEREAEHDPSHSRDISAQIEKATDLYCEIKDVRDEVNILKSVAQFQQIVQRGLFGKDVDESRFSSTYVVKDLKELDSIAERIQEAQSDVANRQATEATRQGKTVMTFTFATVLFLPLSFLSSLFALDVASFQQAPAWAFYVIFFVSIGISAILGCSVFWWDNIKLVKDTLLDIIQDSFERNSSPTSSPPKMPGQEGTASKDRERSDTTIDIKSKSKDSEKRFKKLFRRPRRGGDEETAESHAAT